MLVEMAGTSTNIGVYRLRAVLDNLSAFDQVAALPAEPVFLGGVGHHAVPSDAPHRGIPWGEDLERDCQELRRLEAWGLYPHGHHDRSCALDHIRVIPPGSTALPDEPTTDGA